MMREQKRSLLLIAAAAVLLIGLHFVPVTGWGRLALYLIPYLLVGGETLVDACKGIYNRQPFDENLLMAVATIGAMVGTEGYKYAKKIKSDVQTFNDDAAVAQALDANQIDALVTSTVECVYMVQSEQVKDAKVVGRIAGSTDPNGMGIVLPKDSKLTSAASKAVDELQSDGTLQKLQDEWLAEYTTDLTELK